jgi:GTPase SAR1 family protein
MMRIQFEDFADVFLLCFSVASRASLASIGSKWIPELKPHCPAHAKMVLVATKTELRDDPATVAELAQLGTAPITLEEGIAHAKELGLAGYAETSALTGEGVESLFQSCRAAIVRAGRKSDAVLVRSGAIRNE